MVSNVLDMTPGELEALLIEFSEKYADDSEWQQIRAIFPKEWPF